MIKSTQTSKRVYESETLRVTIEDNSNVYYESKEQAYLGGTNWVPSTLKMDQLNEFNDIMKQHERETCNAQ